MGGGKLAHPVVYLCAKGLVADVCRRAPAARVEEFLRRWLPALQQDGLTPEEAGQLEKENPLELSFSVQAQVNGRPLAPANGCAFSWIPPALLPAGVQPEEEVRAAMRHYALDENCAWMVRRVAFSWATRRAPRIRDLRLHLDVQPTALAAARFSSPAVGEIVRFAHPVTGVQHTLTVQGYEKKNVDHRGFGVQGFEYPGHFTAMTYTLSPDAQVRVCDENNSDQPRPAPGGASSGHAAAIGIIGGEDGPTAILLSGDESRMRIACSALRFEPAETVNWRVEVYERLREPVEIQI